MRWYNDPDYWLISKSVIIADFEDFVEWLAQQPEGQVNFNELRDPNHPLHHSLDDIHGGAMNPYEADALEMAIRSGELDRQSAEILHDPKTYPPGSPEYERAKEEALRKGKPLMNEAAKLQNRINASSGKKFGKAPLPFDNSGNLNPAYLKVVRSSLREQTGIARGSRYDDDFNPYKDGQLVTRIVSGYAADAMGRPGADDGFARWYEPAAKRLGYITTRVDKKTGKRGGGHEFQIPAYYVHPNTVQINDEGQAYAMKRNIDKIARSGGDMGDMLQEVKNMKVMKWRGPRHHLNIDSVHNEVGYDSERASNYAQGLGDPETGEATEGGEVPGGSRLRPTTPDIGILHDDLRNTGFGRWLENPNSKGNVDYSNGGKGVRRLLAEHHGFDEDTINQIFERAQRRSPENNHTRKQHRILQEIHNAENQDGVPGNEWHQSDSPMPGGPITTEEAVIQQPDVPNALVSSRAPLRDHESPPEERIQPPPPPRRVSSAPTSNIPSSINANQGLHPTTPLMPPSGPPHIAPGVPHPKYVSDMMDYITERNRMQYPDLLLSDDFAKSLEGYIEDVQMELAKAVIEDYTEHKQMSIENPLDIAILSSRIQRPSNDVISIFHTRGDWRNIAKSFGVEHTAVQLVKVALHG